jgi:hypothetical protein
MGGWHFGSHRQERFSVPAPCPSCGLDGKLEIGAAFSGLGEVKQRSSIAIGRILSSR